MKNLSFLLLFVTFFCASAFAQNNVAVLEIERRANVLNEISREEAMEITNVIRSEAVRTLPPAKFNIMTSETVQSMSGAVLADCADESCIITIGRRIDAEYIVRGTLSKFQTMFTLNIEMFETEYGNLIATADPIRSENLIEILNKSAHACTDMYKKFMSRMGITSTPTPPQTAPAPVSLAPPLQARPEPAARATASNISYGSFTDSRDGKTYRTVVMPDGKTWMAENLNYATRRGSWCYTEDESNCNTYGRLYNWKTARTVCPAGWRLPSDADWSALTDAVGGASTAGRKLKSASGWYNNGNGTDEYGFSALPGGYRYDGGRFYGAGDNGRWWSATGGRSGAFGVSGPWSRGMRFSSEGVGTGWGSKSNGCSVRCVAMN